VTGPLGRARTFPLDLPGCSKRTLSVKSQRMPLGSRRDCARNLTLFVQMSTQTWRSMTTERRGIPMYIGLGTVVLIVVIVLLVMMMRRRRV
jgi:hypothetical protein